MIDVALPSRYVGAMWGLAVGDALAQPFLGRDVVGTSEYSRRVASSTHLTWTAVTDATLGLATSLVTCGGLDVDHLRTELGRRRQSGAWRGYEVHVDPGHQAGLSTRTAVGRVWGLHARQDATAAIRSVPAGLVGAPYVGRASGLARAQAGDAHDDPGVADSAALLAAAVCTLSHTVPGTLDPVAWVRMLSDHVITDEFQRALAGTERWVSGREHPSPGDLAEAFAALPTSYGVVLAIVCFLRHPDSLPEAVRAAVLTGQATTGAAAMAGAMAGAYLGSSAVPAHLVGRLEQAETIRELARDLHALTPSVAA